MRAGRIFEIIFFAGLVAIISGCGSSAPAPPKVAPELDPNDPLAAIKLMQRGQAMLAEGRVDGAVEHFQAARTLQPGNPTIHNVLGVAELRRRNAQAAVASFNRALELAPTYSDARNNRGAAYLQLGQLAMAEADFLAVLSDATYANRAGVFFNLGSLYLRKGNLSAAGENFRRATASGGPVDAYLALADVEERLGHRELAEKAYLEALARAPERADIGMALAKLYESQGRTKEAEEQYQRILSVSPDSPEAHLIRAKQGK
ncbi:MAG: tetratricopeptide repeat protein [Thermoanaerobaculaceae bacterium]|nr:tetratricopeptide repeat protein [Thermoanaerobaculaceae bacterium]MDI9621947.1 tetratricopeptide repeat protein [Acidobacteriota bacterium]NLH12239.1 tetratricopeptide repeat protein [Holophagae bacterium]HPW55639.1 tetratricopeptide repeat protein [Thermoanaerobaculaceae bacterium]